MSIFKYSYLYSSRCNQDSIKVSKGTTDYGLFFMKPRVLDLYGFTDSNWVSGPDDRRNTSSYYMIFGGNVISWSSSKERVITRSSTKAKYI